ncbi:hypothetical protein BGX24_005412 [Mortierella sp. AD032]|nr:hypothetical protein BGX24_005412 [Mortierella sp. AD032]
MQHDSGTATITTAPGTAGTHRLPQTKSSNVHLLFTRILGNPQVNATKAISTFKEEFEAKKTLFTEKDDGAVSTLQLVPAQLNNVKEHLDTGLNSTQSAATLVVEKLQALQQAIATSTQNREKSSNPTRSAKEAFQKDITDAREAFDQEMALRHADVVKQYVGAFVQHIDHY